MRIIVGNIASEWKRILEELVKDDDSLRIIAETKNPVDILLQTKEAGADTVVLSQTAQGAEPGICSHLLLEYPNLQVVLVPSKAGPNVLYRLMLEKEVCQASTQMLATLLRLKTG